MHKPGYNGSFFAFGKVVFQFILYNLNDFLLMCVLYPDPHLN